jgi:DNA topoisomerase IB
MSKRNAQTTRAIENPINFELTCENNALGYPASKSLRKPCSRRTVEVYSIKMFRLKGFRLKAEDNRLKGCRGLD